MKRRQEETKETLPTVENNAPEAKFQQNQQLQNTEEVYADKGVSKDASTSSLKTKRQKASGASLKQEVAATVVKDASYGGSNAGDGLTFSGRAVSGGGSQSVLGAANATPVAGKSRSESRIGKKLDRNSTKLNFIPCDQILVEYDESKPLSEAKDEDQGYNGTYRNEFARSQKVADNVPGALMFDRSVDIIKRDHIYYGHGQVVRENGVYPEDGVRRTAVLNAHGEYVNPTVDNYAAGEIGNVLTEKHHRAIAANGVTVFSSYDEVSQTPVVDGQTANKCSAAAKILMNDAELVREQMDTAAGDEKADIWCPIPRAIGEPTATVGFLRDLEAETGNAVLQSYRKASTGMSYQLNRAHKDGQDPVGPMVDYLAGLVNPIKKGVDAVSVAATAGQLFVESQYRKGSTATMIALFDSVAKYNNKADVLIQPRSLRMHLQTADNNMDPFYADKLYVQQYDAQEVFSTINREYDPMAPVFISDKAALIHRYSWNKLGGKVKASFTYDVKGAKEYSVNAKCTILPASAVEILAGKYIHIGYPHEGAGDITVGDNGAITRQSSYEFANGTTLKIFINDTEVFSAGDGYDTITVAADTLIANHAGLVINGLKDDGKYDAQDNVDYIYYPNGGAYVYVYTDLRNKYVTKVDHPLLKGIDDWFDQMIGSKYASLVGCKSFEIPCLSSLINASLWDFLICAATPFIGKARINSFRDVLYYEKNVSYPFSNTLVSIKEVLTKAYANFRYTDYDHELETGLMHPAAAISWNLPELFVRVGSNKVMAPWYECQNNYDLTTGEVREDVSTMCFPSIRSGVRFASLDALYGMSEKDVRLSIDKIAYFDPTKFGEVHEAYKYGVNTDGQAVFTTADVKPSDVIFAPREIGRFVVAPYATLSFSKSGKRGAEADVSAVGTSSYVALYWTGLNPVTFTEGAGEAILNKNMVNVNRAQNFVATWYSIMACGTSPEYDHGFTLSVNALINGSTGSLLVGRGLFTPFVDNTNTQVNNSNNAFYQVASLQKGLWTRLQKLPFIISPFDMIEAGGGYYDVYDMMYWFGLAGFRASDYRESVYNREKEVVNQGILFVSDPWIEASPIFTNGASVSGIVKTKGFEM